MYRVSGFGFRGFRVVGLRVERASGVGLYKVYDLGLVAPGGEL